MFQNPNDPCNFCLGGQCDSQSPGKAISRLSTRAPSSPSYGGIDRKRIITAVQSPGNQNQPLSLLTSDCAATERVWKRRHCTKYTGGELVGFSQLYEVHHNFTRRRIKQASQGTQVISPPLPPYGVVSSLVVGPLWSMEYEGYAGSLGLSRDWEWRCIKK